MGNACGALQGIIINFRDPMLVFVPTEVSGSFTTGFSKSKNRSSVASSALVHISQVIH